MKRLVIGLILGTIGGSKSMWTQLRTEVRKQSIQELLSELERVLRNMLISKRKMINGKTAPNKACTPAKNAGVDRASRIPGNKRRGRRLGLGAFFGHCSELRQFSVSSPFSPHPPLTRAVGL